MPLDARPGVHLTTVQHEHALDGVVPATLAPDDLDGFRRSKQGEIVDGDVGAKVVGRILDGLRHPQHRDGAILDRADRQLPDALEGNRRTHLKARRPVEHRLDRRDVVIDGSRSQRVVAFAFEKIELEGVDMLRSNQLGEVGAVGICESVQMFAVSFLAIPAALQPLCVKELFNQFVDAERSATPGELSVLLLFLSPESPRIYLIEISGLGDAPITAQVSNTATPLDHVLAGPVLAKLWRSHGKGTSLGNKDYASVFSMSVNPCNCKAFTSPSRTRTYNLAVNSRFAKRYSATTYLSSCSPFAVSRPLSQRPVRPPIHRAGQYFCSSSSQACVAMPSTAHALPFEPNHSGGALPSEPSMLSASCDGVLGAGGRVLQARPAIPLDFVSALRFLRGALPPRRPGFLSFQTPARRRRDAAQE